MQNAIDQTRTTYTHGERIRPATDTYRSQLFTGQQQGITPKLSKAERARLAESISQYDTLFTREGVNFSRVTFSALCQHVRNGGTIEFETLGPYLEAYRAYDGVITREDLSDEDAIGLELATALRHFFPSARLISLYDDYNAYVPNNDTKTTSSGIAHFSDAFRQSFRESLLALYKSDGALTADAIDGVDYLMISESSKVTDAQKLVSLLEAKGYIEHRGEEIIFVNTLAENPLHHRIHLRNSKGKWLCEALDAATFLKEENLEILHIVALPDYMKDQQDKVWEILRVLGISSHRYHNIFYDPRTKPLEVAQTVTEEFNRYL